MKRTTFVVALTAACILIGQVASAAVPKDEYPANYVSRPLTLSDKMGQVGLEFMLGLNSGRAAKDLGLGLNFGYGVISKLEIGADILALSYGKDAQGAKFGGAAIYAKYEVLKWMALYFDVHFPSSCFKYVSDFGDQLLGIKFAVQMKYVIIKDLLDVHGSVGVDVGFASAAAAGQMPQVAMMLEYGLAVSPISKLYIDLTAETKMTFRPSAGSFGDRTEIPLRLTVGSPIINPLDVYLTFSFDNMNPVVGSPIDAKSLMLGAKFRF